MTHAPPPRSEQQIVEAVRRGDQGALGRLLESYQHRIFNTCLRMLGNRDDAAEVTQDTMLKVVEHVRDFHGQSEFATWIIRIAMNLSISHLRKRKLRLAGSIETPSNGQASRFGDDQSTALRQQLADNREPSPESSVERQEMLMHLQTAMTRVEEDFRAVLVLRDIEEMDYQQIADVLAIPVGTVKSRLFRARLALRHEFLRLCPPPKTGGPATAGGASGVSGGGGGGGSERSVT
jgi:RNA polymerase sigma-70 factor (ECF subfamily)